MSDIKNLLATRARIKRRKPRFTRQDQHKKNEIKRTGWRRPRGLHSKMREGRKGYKIKISIGWKSPEAVRGLHPSGLAPILVHTPRQVASIDTKTQGVVIASSVGDKKRLEILKACEGKITILNVKDIKAAMNAITGALSERKQASKARTEKKTKQAGEGKKKALDKKVEDEPKTKEEEKKEQDKVLTQRDV